MTASRSDALVLFGVTGDLAHKMIFPALYAMAKRGTLKVPVIGVAHSKWNLARLRKRATDSIRRSGGIDNQRALHHLLSLLTYVDGDYGDPDTFTAIKGALGGARRGNSTRSRARCSRKTRSSASTTSSEKRRS
jgi:glucose-6-phosphate 1-dehydrogenase